MVDPDPVPWLDGILDCIGWIEHLAAGKSITDYQRDWTMRDAVERNVERISEASRRLPNDLKGMHPEMNWRQIARAGNILRHGYRQVDHALMWEIVELDLPASRTVIERMRREHGADP